MNGVRRRELEIEAGITVYTFDNGVEHRRLAFPFAATDLVFADLVDHLRE